MSDVKPHASGFVPGRGFSREDWDDVCDNPELTDEELAQARPVAEAMPEFHARILAEIARQEAARRPVSIRLDPDVAERLEAIGEGWEGRVNDALRRWLDQAA